ncbi:hydroxyisourate hydrolase [Kitasatospora sp. NPDC093102]|uniref:hydroxyisourate hydrolase n=1 Tax=Kitasatospora sp. NPDC093102 TaxID=3155069 RepID=UPI0034406E41
MLNVIAEALVSVSGRAAGSAVGLHARLEILLDNEWVLLAERRTDGNGLIEEWGAAGGHRGLYRVVFDVDRYFAGLGLTPGYPEVTVGFRASEEGVGYGVTLTFSPHQYTAVLTSS